MGTAASVQGGPLDAFPEVLSRDQVMHLAGKQYRENVFQQIASNENTVTKHQYKACAALAEHGLLKFVAIQKRGASRQPTLSAEEWGQYAEQYREQGKLLDAAVAFQNAFMAMPNAERCLGWLQALHAFGSSAGRLVNLAEGYHKIYPECAEIEEFLINARKKVPQPFEEVEDQLYPLSESERQKVEAAVVALKLDTVRDVSVRMLETRILQHHHTHTCLFTLFN